MINAIYIILLASLSLIYLGFWKEDSWLIILSSFILMWIGLITVTNGFGDIVDYQSKWMYGLLFIFIAIYLSFRASIELFKEVK